METVEHTKQCIRNCCEYIFGNEYSGTKHIIASTEGVQSRTESKIIMIYEEKKVPISWSVYAS